MIFYFRYMSVRFVRIGLLKNLKPTLYAATFFDADLPG